MAPVQGIAGTQRTLSYNRMRKHFGFLIDYTGIVKFTFPLNLDLIDRSLYLLYTRHIAFISIR